MRYHDLKTQLEAFTVFSLQDIRKIELNFYHPRLNEWQKKGYVRKLRRGYYMFTDTLLEEEVLFLIANRIYDPSYVSFEMALSYYGLIPEGVYSITSASSKKTAHFRTPIAEFSYHRVKPELMFGYRLETAQGRGYKIADPEKAVLDYLYLHSSITNPADFYEWRFNSEDFLASADLVKFRQYAAAFKSRGFVARVEELILLIKSST